MVKFNELGGHNPPGKIESEETIYTTSELMGLLKVSRRTVQNWRDRGTIEFSQINGKIYYRMSAINKMLDQNLINNY